MQNFIRYIMPLILLIGLTFNNTASAGLFGIDGLFSGSDFRCKIEYTQLDLSTGLHKVVKITTQMDVTEAESRFNMCNRSVPRLDAKIDDWVDDGTNIVVNLTGIYCKERENSWGLWQSWGKYDLCLANKSESLVLELKYPNKVGYNVNIDRIVQTENIIDE
jgi:hypothetical protein